MNTSRRKFLANAGGSLAVALLTRDIAARPKVAPSDTIRVALMGCKNMGYYDLRDHIKIPGVECVALCDIDDQVLRERSAELVKITNKNPRQVKDYRRLLDDKSIDVLIVATPDHWHCLPTVHACQAGKDVYVEKPLANSIAECEVMVKAARKYDRVVQVGQQQRSGQHWQDALSIVKSGKLGKIRKIKAWGYFEYGRTGPKVPDSPVPEGVDFDMWLGPAPKRSFNTGRFHGNWRFSWDYGGGLLTDWGVHLLDIALWAVDGNMPLSVQSSGGIYAYPDNAIETADTQSVIYAYKDLLIEWEHLGGLSKGPYGRGYGVSFIADNGTLVINRESWELIPEQENGKNKIEAIPVQAADKTDHEKHVMNFIESVKSRKRPICDVEVGRNAAVLAHMGNIAYRTGEKLEWNSDQKQFSGSAKGNALITPAYRLPWKLPGV